MLRRTKETRWIEMAQFAAENGENVEVVKMASGMAEAQAGEIGEMQRLLE